MICDTEIPESLAKVSQEWGDARAHLLKAIETYVGATTALVAASASYPLWTIRGPTLALEIELESLSAGILALDKAQVILANARNTHCSPISRLPSELLASIFQIVIDAVHPRNIVHSASYVNPASILVQVCSRWRRVALGAGSLWSCVVLSFGARNNYESVLTTARMQLERTCGFPTDLYISHGSYASINPKFKSTLDQIKPYMKQLRSLAVDSYMNEDIEFVLERLLDNGTAGSLSRLEISRGSSYSPLFDHTDSQTLDRLDEHLRSVYMLKLRNTLLHWKCAVFQQLGELELEDLYVNMTQFAGMLSASPGLRHLALKHIYFEEERSVTHPSVKLWYLKRLKLDGLGDEHFQRAVSILTLGEQGTDVTISSDLNNTTTLEAFRLFASEANIDAFRLISLRKHQPLHEILEFLPNLQYLVLAGLMLGDSDFSALVNRNTINSNSPALPPSPYSRANSTGTPSRISTLWLIKCAIVFEQATLEQAIPSLCLDYFYLRDCSTEFVRETRMEDGSMYVTSEAPVIDATTELGIWLTENMAGRVHVE